MYYDGSARPVNDVMVDSKMDGACDVGRYT